MMSSSSHADDPHFRQMFADPATLGGSDISEETMMTQAAAAEDQSLSGLSVLKFIQSKYGAALITLVAVFALLIISRPPMIMRDISSNPYHKEYTINWTIVFIWCASASLVVLAIEPLIDVIKRYG